MSDFDDFQDDPLSGLTAMDDHGSVYPGGDPDPDQGAPDHMSEALSRAAGLPLNDYGNGQRFVTHFGRDFMFVPRVGWFNWSSGRWVKDDDMLLVRRRAQGLSDLIIREIPYLSSGKVAVSSRIRELRGVAKSERSSEQSEELVGLSKLVGRHRSFATTTGNSARIDNAAKEAGVDLAVAFDDLDARDLDVNTESGVLRFSVIDASEDGGGKVADVTVLEHQRDQRMTKMMPVTYDPAAPRDRFEAFLQRVQPDAEMRGFLQRWLGLSMTGLPMQRLVFFHGGGANGKSVLVDLMARIMGNYAATARIESLTGSNRRGGGEATPDLIPLMGARMVRTSEPDEGQRLQEGLIKELTGGEPIQVRALHSDFVEVRPVFKLTMSGNHKPEIRGTDDGIWRRVMLVPFDVQIPESERDPELVAKLFEERCGVFAWLVEGLCDFLEGGLRPPSSVTDATREYREESDPIGRFLVNCCVITGAPEDVVTSKVLGDAFNYHLIEQGMTGWKPTTFARQISVKARQWRHPQTGVQFAKGKASVSQYVGLRLTDAFKRRFENAPRDHHGRPIGTSPDPDSEQNQGG